jgi:uncharacterized membrane protein
MAKSWLIHLMLCLVLVLTLSSGLIAATAAFAQDAATPTTTPISLKLESTYPSLSADSGQSFSFDFDIKYSGDRQLFNLNSTTQPGWDVTFTSSSGKTITAVQLGPVDYTVTESTINLKATVKARYSFELSTPTGNLNTSSTSGQENHSPMQVINTGSAAIDKLAFTATSPEGWIVTFSPNQIETIGAGQTQQVEVIITPPGGKTVAGDYMVNITANNGTISRTLDLRVTVSTPTIWGWVGIIIVVLVIAGLAVLFVKLGRR